MLTLYNVELYGLYPSPNFIRVVKLRRMIWAGYVPRLGDKRDLLGKPEWNIHLEDLAVDDRILLI
jgi:hypothetical protein